MVKAQGVTQVGASALSWCADANLTQVADLFLRHIKSPSDIDHRAARHVNPALLPTTRSLLEMAETAKNDVKTLVLMCLSQPTPISFNVSKTWLNDLPVIVGANLLERYDPTVSALDPAIVSNWRAAG